MNGNDQRVKWAEICISRFSRLRITIEQHSSVYVISNLISEHSSDSIDKHLLLVLQSTRGKL